MNIKLPGSIKAKKILLIVLIIISICVLSYEFIKNKSDNKIDNTYNQEQFIGDNSR